MLARSVLIVAVGLWVGGCAPARPEAGAAPEPNPQSRLATDVDARVERMRELTDELAKLSRTLPARDEAGQREAMRRALDVSARVLPLLMGPEADGQFRLQQRIVADARDRLGRGDDRLAQEPTINSGLRAVYNALVRVSQESFYTSPTVTADLTELGNRVDDLDRVRGAMHRGAAARAVAQAAVVMDRMTRIYMARLERREPAPAVPNPKGPAEQPAATGAGLQGS